MTQVSFYCASSWGVLLDKRVVEVRDLFEARDCAKHVAWSIIKTAHPMDWRSCRLYVRDNNGKELFVMPFSWALGRRQRFVSFWQTTGALQY